MAPPASRVPGLMADLLGWLAATDAHPLVVSLVLHYEFEFIHPFADGNGRMGRLWQSLILARWNPLFADLPVESLIFEHQAEYYEAIQESTRQTDSAPLIEFMLGVILAAVLGKPSKLPLKSLVCWGFCTGRWDATRCNRCWVCVTASRFRRATSGQPWMRA